MAENKKLMNEFPPISMQQWEEVIRQDLAGADYEKKLVWKPLDGISVRPYYRAENTENLFHINALPGEFPYVRGNKTQNNSWEIRQDIKVKDVKKANADALEILSKGATSIGFMFEDDFKISQDEFSTLIKGIDLKKFEINFVANHGIHAIFALLATELKKQNLKDVKGSASFDPFGNMSIKGKFMVDEKTVFGKIKEIIEYGKNEYSNFRILTVNAKHFSNAGSSIVQELAFGLAMGSEYLHRATDTGLAIDDITSRMQFVFGIGPNYFMEIAKIRAARLLWAKIVEAYQPKSKDACKMFIHSVTLDWNKTIFDPNTNMLRTTTEGMSAAIGGTDSLTIEPYDKTYKEADEFSLRIARNQQIILKEESYLDRIVDVSAGSYYIENLTASIAEAAWKLFLEVDAKGGYLAAFKEGFIQSQIEDTANKRYQNIATRREILVGTNQYPNFTEKIKQNIDLNIVNQTIKTAENDLYGKPLKLYRGAKAFEELRLRTEMSGKTPKVFMFTYGNLAMRLARSQFSSNFFACAGFEVIDNNGFPTIDDGVKAAINANANMVVICSSDEEYATIAPEIHEKLKEKAVIVVAGAPACTEELKAKGITNFISVKSNVLEELKRYQSLLKI